MQAETELQNSPPSNKKSKGQKNKRALVVQEEEEKEEEEEQLPFGLTYYNPYFTRDDQAIIATWGEDTHYTWYDMIQHVVNKLYPRLQQQHKLC
jgi:hypothetical protein